ncbi:Serine/threonine-protein phosphatase 4 regulatory subunit 2 [Elsinoe australis]|uniref:Serine/threonine-protein phosphatase 4 regulatory subunit 2 n=1 Tax=Elsinoe australis TaxID=40998 RepID=A0A2P7ZMM2_9PEZI|nr:Serine/threonine-protein phosphatase 4 regulatory subunit 2 [Elsinoe australis]
MATNQEILEAAARDGSLDIAEWPKVLENVLQRLHDIVYSEFPFPANPPTSLSAPPDRLDGSALGASPLAAPSPSQRNAQQEDVSEADPSSQASNTSKENAAPTAAEKADTSMGPPPSRSATAPLDTDDALAPYPEMAASYKSSMNILKTSFAKSPPYTVQRLAELVLNPRKHYRHLPSFLNALDRIVSVSSSTTAFPLLHQSTTTNGMLFQNGEDEQANGVTGDEGLGGALLTPIPWLRHTNGTDDIMTRQQDGELHSESTETIEGPNGAGRIETVSVTVNGVSSAPPTQLSPTAGEEQTEMSTEQTLREQGAVTQGELIRQEQEAGVVPVAQTTARRNVGNGGDAMTSVEEEEGEELPHARGPEEIGMSDLGPQEGHLGAGRPLDLDAALGRRSKSPQPPPEEEGKEGESEQEKTEQGQEATEAESGAAKDDEGEYVLVDTEMAES